MDCRARIRREIQQLKNEPPPGIFAWVVNDDIKHLQAGLRMFIACVRKGWGGWDYVKTVTRSLSDAMLCFLFPRHRRSA